VIIERGLWRIRTDRSTTCSADGILTRDKRQNDRTERVAIYEYEVVLTEPTPAVMSKVADQRGAPVRQGPPKFQYYAPAGLGVPVRRRLLGYSLPDGTFVSQESTP
jgi:hypothetical protein